MTCKECALDKLQRSASPTVAAFPTRVQHARPSETAQRKTGSLAHGARRHGARRRLTGAVKPVSKPNWVALALAERPLARGMGSHFVRRSKDDTVFHQMRVACCQLDIAWEDRPANYRKVSQLIGEARLAPGSLWFSKCFPRL